MKTQISRDSFRSGQRYSGVYQQQGRMLTDADWNELTELIKQRINEVIHDAIGSGAPRDRGLGVLDNFRLQPGYLYIDGIIAQLPGSAAIGYQDQPDFSEAQTLPLSGSGAPTIYTLYADIWERTVIPLEDNALLDAGLHGADTCTRSRTMLQVKWCETSLDPTASAVNPSKGNAPLTVTLWRASSGADPCDPCATEVALDHRVGNYLFRAEVHDLQQAADGSAQLTLKWSSENGAEQHRTDRLPPGFKQGDWVYEFFNLACEENLGVHLAKGFAPSRGQLLTSYPAVAPVGKPWVRRWDGSCVLQRTTSDAWSFVSGNDKGVTLSTALGSQARGHVAVGSDLDMNLDAMAVTLGLGLHQFVAGDFWLATVREATNVAGDILLASALPQGIEHHYLVLAKLDGAGVVKEYADDADRRRMEFPQLSDLWAKDVGYDNENCGKSQAENVQEALDWLCKQRDLRFHNKRLHGWGIVCGLQVECGPDTCRPESEEECQRRQVTIRKGYAIDCEGNDIVLESARDEDLLALVAAHDEANPTDPIVKEGNGMVSLSIALGEGGAPTLNVEKYDPKQDTWANLLNGTLLMDFYNDCIKRLVEAIQDELTADPEEKNALVGPTARRWISLLNLFIQLLNTENGRHVYISAKEHDILQKFYERLQQLLRSKTFCAMFEGDSFPDYPFPESKLSTIFGKGFHSRIRLSRGTRRAYTCRGTDNTINVYDTAKEELLSVVEMPAGEGTSVMDVAFSPDGATLYAIAHLASGDTVLGVADIDAAGDHVWRPVRVLCGVQLTVLAASKDGSRLYAVGMGAGLYLFDPKTMLTETGRPDPWYIFNAAGYLSFDESSGRAYASANLPNVVSPAYTRVVRLDLKVSGSKLAPQETIVLTHPDTGGPIVGTDDLLMISAKESGHERLCVVTRPWDASDESKHLLVFNRNDNGTKPEQQYDLPKTLVSLAWNPKLQRLLVGLEDSYCLRTIDLDAAGITAQCHPLQLAPVSLDCAGNGSMVYALNFISNTISVIPLDELETDEKFNEQLVAYRDKAIAAYWGLAGGLLQYLKDCFCHHLLVRCHECSEDDKVYLAGIQIKGSKIFKICNFSKRKYVKSFPTVEYWLSLIPILPLFSKLVERFCCLVLPDIFQEYYNTHVHSMAAGPTSYTKMAGSKLQSAQLRQGIKVWQGASLQKLWDAEKTGLGAYVQLFRDSILNRVESVALFKPGVDRSLVLNTPVADAKQRLQSQDIRVEAVKTYDRATDANLQLYTGTPTRLDPGSKVTLYEQDGKVLYYTLVPEQTAVTGVADDVRAEIDTLERRKVALQDLSGVSAEYATFEARRADVSNLASSREELTNLEQQKGRLLLDVSGIKAELAGLQAQRAQLADVQSVTSRLEAARAQLEALRKASEAESAAVVTLEIRRKELSDAIAGSSTELETLLSRQRQVVVEINKMQPVSTLAGVDAATAKLLAEAGINTVGELALAKPNILGRAKIDAAAATKLIEAARQRTNLL